MVLSGLHNEHLAGWYIKVVKIKVHHRVTTSFDHLCMRIDTWQDTANEIISKLGFVGVELTLFAIGGLDHQRKHV